MKDYLKKIILLGSILIFSISFVYADTITYIGCGNQKGISYNVPGVVREIINIIKFAVPIILILIGSIDLFKVIFSGAKDDLGKAGIKLFKRCLAAAAVFFVVVLVQLLLSLLGKDSDGLMACISCFVSDESKCYTYEVEKVDYTEEAEKAQKEREELEAKREEIRKQNEEEANKIKEENSSSSSSNSSSNSTGIVATKTIYIGDSRTVGMCASLSGDWSNCQFGNGGTYKYNNNEFFIAQGAMGYDWFVSTAIPAVKSILNSNSGTTFNIVSYMGINGLGADKYVTKYKELANGDWKGHNIILVSINPVDEAKEAQNGYSTKTSSIQNFNTKIKNVASSLSNAYYCDTYNAIINNFSTSDGIHYTSTTYKDIYNETKTCISKSSASSSSNSSTNNCQKSGTYNGTKFCAPNPNYKFGSTGTTPGCGSASVQHDSSFPLQTPIYAAIDGTVYYYQTHCKGVLYSYGNQAKLVGSDGTYIIYAHLNSFPSGITATYTKTCTPYCPASSCSGGVSSVSLGSKTVKAGDLIGYSGTTGNSTGPHLHVEIHYKGGSCISNLNSAFGL